METTKEAPGSFGAMAEEGLALIKQADRLIFSLQTQLAAALHDCEDKQKIAERAVQVGEALIAERRKALSTLVTMRLRETHMAALAAGELTRLSCWFQLTPLPDDYYDFTIKGEKDAVKLLTDCGAVEVKE